MINDKDRILLVKIGGAVAGLSVLFAWLSDQAVHNSHYVTGLCLTTWSVLFILLAIWCHLGAIKSE